VKEETLAASSKWFKDPYKVTPATSVTVTFLLEGGDPVIKSPATGKLQIVIFRGENNAYGSY
jgi:hypothetical protein